MTRQFSTTAGLSMLALLAAACGSSPSGTLKTSPTAPNSGPASGATAPGAGPAATSAATTSAPAPSGPGALSAEAHAAATGDIPDNQVFLVFTNHGAGYAMKYPEGWTQNGPPRRITFSDKNNLVRVVIARGSRPTISAVAQQLQALKRANPSLTFTPPRTIELPAGAAVAATYTTQSAPDPVTNKRVTLIVNRYVVARGSRVAIVDLGTPKGVDNVDAYRMMIQSFHWL